MKNNMYDERGFLKPEYIEKDDPRTDFGKGLVFKKTDDGEYTSIKDIEQANKVDYDRIDISQLENVSAYIEEKDGSYLSELLQPYDHGQQDNNKGLKR